MLRTLNGAALLALWAARQVACEPEQYYASDVQQPLAVENATVAGCHQACRHLQSDGHADLVTHYPHLPPGFSEQFYANQQGERVPVCAVEPRSAEAVSIVVKTVREHRCPFAVKSGGHSLAPGTSNIHDGLLIDLKQLNGVVVSEDRSTVSVGPGGRWGDVFATLEPQGLMVVGGRVNSVGVGGFTLGGGLSFISRRYGWAIDNVRNFEVVLPDGTVVDANPESHPDIYFALRGGGSSFGVVTRLDLEAHPIDRVWGGTGANIVSDIFEAEARVGAQNRFHWTLNSVVITGSRWFQRLAILFGLGMKSTSLIEAFVDLSKAEQLDRGPHAYIFFSWIPEMRAYFAGTTYLYSERVEESPAVLKGLSGLPTLTSTHRQDSLLNFTAEVEEMNPRDTRQHWRTSTFKVNAELISKVWDLLIAENDNFRHAVPGALLSSNVQLVTQAELAMSAKNGGNAFGIDAEDGPLFFFSVTVSYERAEDDERVRHASETIISKAVELGKQLGLHHRFIYPNYAAKGQNVFAGYSPKNLERLAEIQERYDPGRVFANLQPEHLRFRVK